MFRKGFSTDSDGLFVTIDTNTVLDFHFLYLLLPHRSEIVGIERVV